MRVRAEALAGLHAIVIDHQQVGEAGLFGVVAAAEGKRVARSSQPKLATPQSGALREGRADLLLAVGDPLPGFPIRARRLRGTFLSMNGAVQQLASGGASYLGGALIVADASGNVAGYGMVGYLAVGATLAAMAFVGQLQIHTTAPPIARKA